MKVPSFSLLSYLKTDMVDKDLTWETLEEKDEPIENEKEAVESDKTSDDDEISEEFKAPESNSDFRPNTVGTYNHIIY